MGTGDSFTVPTAASLELNAIQAALAHGGRWVRRQTNVQRAARDDPSDTVSHRMPGRAALTLAVAALLTAYGGALDARLRQAAPAPSAPPSARAALDQY